MAISEENTRIQVTIPKDLKKQLEEKAKAENRSVSNYIVTVIQKDLANSSPILFRWGMNWQNLLKPPCASESACSSACVI